MSEVRWEVPESWAWATAGNIAKIVGGGTPSSQLEDNFSENGIPWITPADLTGYRASHIGRGRRDLSPSGFASCGAQMIPSGSVLFSSRAPIGYCVIASNDVSTNQGFKSLVLDGDICSDYIRHYLISAKEYAESKASGTTFMELSGARVAELSIPIAPLQEQQRIVAKIDSLTARTARARADLDRIPNLIARYKSRLLALAFSGELTAAWREANMLSAGDQVELSEVAQSFKYGSSAKSAKEGTVPVLRMGNIQDGKLDWSNLVYTSDPKEIASYRLEVGDILFNRTNSPELVGKTALYQGEREAIYAGYLIKVTAGPRLIPTFLAYCLNSPLGRTYSWEVKTDGVSQSNINARKLAAFRFWLPSLEEQAEIVRRIESAFGWLDRVAADYHAAAKLLPKLDAAILAKAFCGKLVPQDTNDEPAMLLLDRIRADQTGSPKKGRAGSSRLGSLKMDASPQLVELAPRLAINRSQTGKIVIKERHDPDVYGNPYLADILRKGAGPCKVEVLQSASKLRVADFYKQLAWEIDQGLVRDGDDGFEVI